MKKTILILFFILLYFFSFSQESKRENIWMLGMAAAPGYPQFGVDFNSGNADTFSLLRPMAFYLTNASICDTNGQILFYTNGNYVANRFHQMMPGTAGFNPGDENNDTYPYGSGAMQGALIVPWPNRPDGYVIFHLNGDWFSINNWSYERPLNFYYSEINMLLDSGKGDFTNNKNVLLINDTLVIGRITACKHANGRDWWILAHELWSNRFYEYLLTPDSISLYQSIYIGSVITHTMDVIGTGLFSQNGEKFAYLNYDTTLNIFDFNRCTGDLTNPVYVYFNDTANLATINCAFSASGRYLYVCNNFHIFQLDMLASDIAASKTIVSTYDNFHTSQGFRTINLMMKLAPDNKIYVSTAQGSNVFHEIHAPDSAGLDCRVTQHSFILPDFNAASMPNTPNYALGPLAGSVCDSLHIGIDPVNEKNVLLTIFPNPSKGIINMKFEESFLTTKNKFIVYNILGEIVCTKQLQSRQDFSNINLSDLSNGVYTITITINNQKVNSRFVLMK
jgi:hypothetical protein